MSRNQSQLGRPDNFKSDLAKVLFGPWPIRPLVLGIFLALFFQNAITDTRIDQPLEIPNLLYTFFFSAARAAAITIPMWLMLKIRERATGGAPLTRFAYLSITILTAFWAGTIRYVITFDTFAIDLSVYWIFVTRIALFILLLQLILGLIDQRLRGQVERADAAVTEVSKQRQVILETEERARENVARILHDRVQAGLVVIGLQLRQLSDFVSPETKGKITSIINDLEQIRSEDVRAASRILSPDISTTGLESALADLARRYAPAMLIDVEVAGASEAQTVDPVRKDQVMLGIYRVVEQALLNSAAHGHATKVQVNVRFDAEMVVLEVRDNGKGLDGIPRQGSGLVIIDAWIGSLEGTWSLVGDQGHGTVLQAKIPLTSHM